MKPILLLITFLYALSLKAQTGNKDTLNIDDKAYKFSAKKLIVPSVFISYGIVSLTSPKLKELNLSTRHETREHFIAGVTIDNYMQYAPLRLYMCLILQG